MRTLLRSGLITPGIDRRMLEKAAASEADLVHIELEDGVSNEDKARARDVVVSALSDFDWGDKLTFVRVNGRDSGHLEADISAVTAARPVAFLQGKCAGPRDIVYLDGLITRAEVRAGIPYGTVKVASMIERVSALETINQIAAASPRMIALYLGPGDLGNEYGYRRSYGEQELEILWPHTAVVLAAHKAGLIAISSPYLYYTDLEGTETNARWTYSLGFDIKMSVSPRQIATVNRAFTPSEEEIAWAEEILRGETAAAADGKAVWASDGMMADAPFVIRANRIMECARAAGVVAPDAGVSKSG